MHPIITGFLLAVAVVSHANANERVLDFRLNYLPNHLDQHFELVSPRSGHTQSAEPVASEAAASSYKSITDDPNHIALLVSEDGVIQLEHYAYGAKPDTPLFVYSVTKSFSALMLLQRLCERGPVDLDLTMGALSPRLRGTVYENVSIRNVLHMQSGNGKNFFKEQQIPIFLSFLRQQKTPIDWIKGITSADNEPGKNFWYNANDTNALGVLLEDLSGSSIAANFRLLFTDEIQPYASIYWMKAKDGQQPAAYGLMATGRDLIALAKVWQRAYTEDSCLKGIFTQIDRGNVSNGEYGFQLWRNGRGAKNSPPKTFYMKGAGGQILAFDLDANRIVFAYSINEKYKSCRIQDLVFK